MLSLKLQRLRDFLAVKETSIRPPLPWIGQTEYLANVSFSDTEAEQTSKLQTGPR